MKQKILIVDDEEKLRKLLSRLIALEGFHVLDAATANAAEKILATEDIDVALCDVKLPDGNGVEFTSFIKKNYPFCEVILMTAYGNIADGVAAMKNGAFDYIVKGNDNDKIIPLLSRASEKAALQKKVTQLEARLSEKFGYDAILGESASLKEAISLARKVAPTSAPVLLTGETGTGKEVFAQAIHYSGGRGDMPFVALNCSALSKDIMESELFGHKSGAFTGALKDKKGLVEEAKGGTLFLDELGEMPLSLQPKLLRFLENGTYYRVGDTLQRSAEVRLIAATNRNLKKETDNGNFRSDLYYRIAVFSIDLPPLRERRDDVLLLARYFLNYYATKMIKPVVALSPEACQILLKHNWPGNVRELKNVLERAVILEDSTVLTPESLPYELQHENENRITGQEGLSLAEVELKHIAKILKMTGGNKVEAAKILGIGLATLYRKTDDIRQ